MYGYIYETTNLINGKRYIGRHKSEVFDARYLGSGTVITKAIQKYGKSNFNVKLLCECQSNEELDKKEQQYIELYNAQHSDEYYNIAKGGHHNISTELLKELYPESYARYRRGLEKSIATRQTAEHRAKLSKMFSAHPPAQGLKHTEETKRKIARYGVDNSFYGKHHTTESKRRVSEANTGRKHTEQELQKMANSHRGKTHSDETKKKMSEARKRYWASRHSQASYSASATTIESVVEEKLLNE